ncbi:MAG: hypothetical protein KGJ84_13495 [Elusimicrobia bacterium]|nr:hypothetical protein [Elusimicrobiota bacterium]
MSPEKPTPAEKLVHDVNSKGSGLRSAAAMLKNATDAEAGELLTMMTAQARSLVDAIDAYRRARGL